MKEIAVYGGAFDPPTLAHEAIIGMCLEIEFIDEVWLMPSGRRQDKPNMQDDDTRLAMLDVVHRESFDYDDRLVVTDFEINLGQPTQTIDTVEALKNRYAKDNFWFVFGADSYRTMPSWDRGDYLNQTLNMLIIPRLGEVMPATSTRIGHLAMARLSDSVISRGVSSTKVRQALVEQAPIDGMVSQAIASYIDNHGCYIS